MTVQDVMWLDSAAENIASTRIPAYFVCEGTVDPDRCNEFYVVVKTTEEFLAMYKAAWRRLTKDDRLRILLFRSKDEERDIEGQPGDWDCHIIHHPSSIDALAQHPVDESEMILQAKRPGDHEKSRRPDFIVNTFRSRSDADQEGDME